jgi:hypothetical protein
MKNFLILIFLFLISACSKGTRIGNPTTVTFNIVGSTPNLFSSLENELWSNRIELFQNYTPQATTNLSLTNSSGTVIGTLTLSSAKIGLSEIKIQNTDSATDSEANFKGPYLVDLLNNQTTPSFSNLSISSDTYNQIKLKLDKIEAGDVTANPGLGLEPGNDFVGNSIRLVGSYSGSTQSGTVSSMPTILEFDFDEEFELNASTGKSLDLTSAESMQVLVAFRLGRWFSMTNTITNGAGLDFSVVTPQSGQILLNENSSGSESQLRQVIKENIKKSADFGVDTDQDGTLDSSEDTDELENENESEWD